MSLTAKSFMVSPLGAGTDNTTEFGFQYGSGGLTGGKNQMQNQDTVGFPSEAPNVASLCPSVSPITCMNPQRHRGPGKSPSYISPLLYVMKSDTCTSAPCGMMQPESKPHKTQEPTTTRAHSHMQEHLHLLAPAPELCT
jgi:hypothetical protein